MQAGVGEQAPRGRAAAVRTLFGLAIAYSPSYVNPLLRRAGVDRGPTGPRSVLLWNCVAAAALLAYVVVAERRGPGSIGFRRPRRADVGWAVLSRVVATAAAVLLVALVPPAKNEGLETVTKLPFGVLVALVLTTATTEEVLFRGYPIERLTELTGRAWVAVAISIALFVRQHVRFFGPAWALYNGVGVVLMYVL